MDHTDSTIPNTEQAPPQAASDSGSDVEEVELLYIWINQDETGFIREQGFNFSPNYRFEMRKAEDGQQYVLSCTETPSKYNVWNTDSIVNLTAVVGENGSGKSSLLRHLLDPSGDYSRQHKLINIYRCGRNIKMYHSFSNEEIMVNAAFQIEKASLNEVPKQTSIFMTNSMDTAPVGKRQGINDLFFFSPAENKERARTFFEKARHAGGLNEDSRFGLLQQLFAMNRDFSDFDKFVAVDYFLFLLKHDEQAKKDAINENASESVNSISRMLGTCSQQITLVAQNSILDMKDSPSYFYQNSKPEVYARIFKDFPEWDPNRALHPVDAICWAFIFELDFIIRSIPKPNVHGPNLDENLIKLDFDSLEEGMQKMLGLYEAIEKHNKDVLQYYQAAKEEIHELRILGDKGKKVNVNANQSYQGERNGMIIHRDKDPELYRNLCQHIHDWMRKDRSFVLKYIGIQMTPISSGEKALQNIFSWLRLSPSLHEVLGQTSVPIADNILLLLDEIDLYMHPEWQRKFLKLLSDKLNAEYPKKHIQIVISTHSPLVLSDIPSGNIIYLEKNGKKCTIAQRPDAGESFGTNIFSLLKDSFYLKRSLGEFAHSRIEAVIKDLNALKKNPSDEKLREICRSHRQFIEIIGEPVIKRKLQNLYTDLFGADPEDAHRRDLAELSRLLESGDPAQRDRYRALLKNMLSEAKRS